MSVKPLMIYILHDYMLNPCDSCCFFQILTNHLLMTCPYLLLQHDLMSLSPCLIGPLSVSHAHQDFLPQGLCSTIFSVWNIPTQVAYMAGPFSVFRPQPKRPQRELCWVHSLKLPLVLPQIHLSEEFLSFSAHQIPSRTC